MEKLYSIKQAAMILGIHPMTVWRKTRSGEIVSCRAGRLVRIAESALRAYLYGAGSYKVDHFETRLVQADESKRKSKTKVKN